MPRVIFDKTGIKIAPVGFDAATLAPESLLFSSDFSTLRVGETGVAIVSTANNQLGINEGSITFSKTYARTPFIFFAGAYDTTKTDQSFFVRETLIYTSGNLSEYQLIPALYCRVSRTGATFGIGRTGSGNRYTGSGLTSLRYTVLENSIE